MSDVVDRVVVALNAGDVDAFVACYTEDATIENGHDTVMVRGHDELRTKYGEMFERMPDIRIEALTRTDVGDFVVQEERVTGRGEPERHIAVYFLQEGRIKRERLLR
jgi:hypothetical protein